MENQLGVGKTVTISPDPCFFSLLLAHDHDGGDVFEEKVSKLLLSMAPFLFN
jgi:hypothetical protein